jgi:hypothetical protein
MERITNRRSRRSHRIQTNLEVDMSLAQHGRIAVWARAVAGFLALGTIASCGGATTAGGAPRFSVRLTDAPGDVQAAVVTIAEIDLQGSHGSTVLMNTPVTTDLTTLAGTTTELVSGAVVPPGTYAQLRFVITGAYIKVDNGDGTSSIYASSPDYAGLPSGAHDAGNGTFTAAFPFLAPGDYSLTFTAPTGVTFTTSPTVPATEHIASGDDPTTTFTVTAVSLGP